MTGHSFSSRAASAAGSAIAVSGVTPDDDRDLPDGPARALFVGAAGVLVIHDARGARVEIVSGDSQYHPIEARRVLAAGTTAGAILALY